MSDDGWGSTPASQPAPAAGGAQVGFDAPSKHVGPAGDAPAKSSGFGQSNNGFGSSSAQSKSASFGGGAGFGGGSSSNATQSSGFGVAAATGGSNAAPSAGFGGCGFGSTANSGSSSVSKPAGFGSFGSAAGGSTTTQSSGFGGSKPSGFGAASGQPSNDAKPSGFGGSSGFGATSSGSDGAAKSASGFGNASGGSSGGFGAASKPSGFGSSAGFGSAATSGGTSSGFGASSGGSSGFGGSTGFGGGFGTSGGSSGFGGGSSGGGGMRCYNCNNEGHRSNECPEPKKSRGGCHNCGQEGHMSRECPEPRKPRDGARTGGGFGASSGGSGFGGGASGGSGFGGGFGGGFGDAGTGAGQSERPRGCFNCGEDGHRSAECTQPRKERPAGGGCYNCGQEGHRSSECTEPAKPREDGAKPASTFIPEEEAPEALYNAGVEKGTMFERFFEAAVTTTLGGLEGEKKESADVYERFDQFGLGDKILQNINQSGFSKPTPVQKHAMPVIMAGNDLLACAQTGSGKTAAFLLPVMSKLIKDSDMNDSSELGCFPRCVIIAPTRELAVQIYNESRKLANGTILSSCVVYGGTQVSHQRNQLMKGATIVVGTTGRLNQFIQDGTISLDKVRFLILDEADRMLDMGFGEDITRITQHATIPDKKARQTLMFSATFPTDVQTAARILLKDDYVMVTIDSIGAANKCITQEIIKCDQSQKKDKLLELLNIDIEKYTVDKKSDVFNKKTLIFVSKKSFADTLGAIVSSSGLPATTIHGDRLQNERHEAMRDFASGRKAVMIATAVAERGLDIKGVDHVINYDLPEEIDQYVHRIGRTGRVGNSGRATSLYTEYNQKIAQGLLKCMSDAGQIVPDWLESEASGCGSGDGASGFGGGFSSAAPINQEEEW